MIVKVEVENNNYAEGVLEDALLKYKESIIEHPGIGYIEHNTAPPFVIKDIGVHNSEVLADIAFISEDTINTIKEIISENTPPRYELRGFGMMKDDIFTSFKITSINLIP